VNVVNVVNMKTCKKRPEEKKYPSGDGFTGHDGEPF
jgi:hypothetical protein